MHYERLVRVRPGQDRAPPAKAVAAAPTTPAPAAPAKWVAPVKGVATIEVVRGPAKVVGKEIVTTFKLKNTSTGSINLLKADQDWYDKERGKQRARPSANGMYRKPFLPGEVIDFELRAPLNGKPDVDQHHCSRTPTARSNAKMVKSFDAQPRSIRNRQVDRPVAIIHARYECAHG